MKKAKVKNMMNVFWPGERCDTSKDRREEGGHLEDKLQAMELDWEEKR